MNPKAMHYVRFFGYVGSLTLTLHAASEHGWLCRPVLVFGALTVLFLYSFLSELVAEPVAPDAEAIAEDEANHGASERIH